MILVDTSIWVDHLRSGDSGLTALLQHVEVLMHPAVIGEIALGNLSRREEVLSLMASLPQAAVAQDHEVLAMISSAPLHGRGIGYVDACLLVATMLTAGAGLWTRDRRLASMAVDLGVAAGSARRRA